MKEGRKRADLNNNHVDAKKSPWRRVSVEALKVNEPSVLKGQPEAH